MYYEVIKRDVHGNICEKWIKNLSNVRNYVWFRDRGYEMTVILPEIVEIVPSSMRPKGWRLQSFYMEDTNQNLWDFFNCDNFKHLEQIFIDNTLKNEATLYNNLSPLSLIVIRFVKPIYIKSDSGIVIIDNINKILSIFYFV